MRSSERAEFKERRVHDVKTLQTLRSNTQVAIHRTTCNFYEARRRGVSEKEEERLFFEARVSNLMQSHANRKGERKYTKTFSRTTTERTREMKIRLLVDMLEPS